MIESKCLLCQDHVGQSANKAPTSAMAIATTRQARSSMERAASRPRPAAPSRPDQPQSADLIGIAVRPKPADACPGVVRTDAGNRRPLDTAGHGAEAAVLQAPQAAP